VLKTPTAPHPPADAGPSLSPLAQGEGTQIAPSPRLRGEGWGEGPISVVIPTLNAAETLPETLVPLRRSVLVGEVIVVDGGSIDASVALAQTAGARVVVAPRGRGTQLAAGAAAAVGDWLLFLHADCRLEANWETAAGAFLAASGAARRAGYFNFALDDPAPAARRLERIVAWRCRTLALPYGDQGLLIARTLYDAVGGFAALPLMEDVDLVRRLGRRRLAAIEARCFASAHRYRRDGYVRRTLRNLLCLSLYLAGVPPSRIVRLYG
jgi:rSAM/selenodomain-associated transferase 2